MGFLPQNADFVEKSTHCLGRQMCAFFWCGRRDLILARTARSVFHGRGRPPEVRSVPFSLQVASQKQEQPEMNSSCSCMVRTTGLPPVAALADEQLSTVRSYGQIANAIFSLFQVPFQKQKQPEMNSSCSCLVRTMSLVKKTVKNCF